MSYSENTVGVLCQCFSLGIYTHFNPSCFFVVCVWFFKNLKFIFTVVLGRL